MAATKRSKKQTDAKKDRASLMVLFDEYKGQNSDHGEPDETDPKVGRDNRGRPTVMTKQALQKLRDAFCFGCTDEEAYIYAGISNGTFYNYCEAHPEFVEEKEELKQKPVMAARSNIVRDIILGDSGQSWEYLRAKRKKEFANLAQQEVTVVKTLNETEIEEAEAQVFNMNIEPEKPKTHVFTTKPKVAE